jgi:hypothetical protein
VHSPEAIPFFSDELYAWLVQPEAGTEVQKLKLKYDMKEYQRLFAAWVDFRATLVSKGVKEVRAVDVEKVAFVLGHWHLLGLAERERVVGAAEAADEAPCIEEGKKEGAAEKDGVVGDTEDMGIVEKKDEVHQGRRVEKVGKKVPTPHGKRNKAAEKERQNVEDDPSVVRRSKRLKR